MAPSERRYCTRCKKQKSINSFSNDSSRADGKFPWCKTCQNEGTRANAFQDETHDLNGYTCPMCDTPIRGHANRRFCSLRCKETAGKWRKFYNLTPEQGRALIAVNKGRCPICKRTVRTAWHFDHDHKTGKVTGAVCGRCNVGPLAMTYHDLDFVRSLYAYLENTPAMRLGIDAIVTEQVGKRPSNLQAMWQHQGFRGHRKTGGG